MSTLLNRYATPFITGLFLVSLISGVAIFFHWQTGVFKGMHEWLSMVLIVPFALHIWKNWRPMVAYLSKPAFAVASVASVVAALVFAYPALTGSSSMAGGPPPFAFATKMLNGAPKDVAPILGKSTDDVVKALTDAGFTAATADKKLSEIATASGKNAMELMSVLNK